MGGKYSIISNPLILPNTGHTGDLGDAQTPVRGGPRRSSHLDLPRDQSSKGCHTLTCWGSSSPRGPMRSSRLDLPRDPILGRPSRLDLPGDLISRRLSRLSLPGYLHPDPGTPGSQVATVLGKMNLYLFLSTVGKLAMSYKSLNSTQHWSHWRSWGCPNSSLGGPRRSSRLDLPRDPSLRGCHASTCSGIL